MPTMTKEKEIQPAGKDRAEVLLDRFKELLSGRQNFESYWQTLHDYFYLEANDFNKSYYPGSELDSSYLWDSTTIETADVLASGFMNYLTPPSAKWFRLRTKNPALGENKAVADFLENVAEEVNYTLNRSNFYDQIFPSYKSSGVYGTSVLLEEEDIHDDARFYTLPLKQVAIVEDAAGRAAEYYIEFEYTAFQAASRFGVEKLSTPLQEELKTGRNDNKKHKFVLFIAKRNIRDVGKMDRKNLPVEAVWIERDAKKIIDEGGYNEFPAMCHRFDKRPFITWGFSPAMKALPFARILNAIAKTSLRSMMKHTDPAIALPENSFIMPFNMNPRAVNYYKKGSMDDKSLITLSNTGDPSVGLTGIEYYSTKVKKLMYNDVFLAFENLTKQMNNPEVMERINEKMTLLGPAVGRFTAEVLNPIIIRTVGILFRRGKLPEPPQEILEDPTYEIDFVGQLAQAQKRSELNSIVTGLTMVGQMAQMVPDVLDKVNTDRTVDEIWSVTGAPVQLLRDDSEIQALREARAEQAAQVNQMQQMGSGAAIAKTASEAERNFRESKGGQTV